MIIDIHVCAHMYLSGAPHEYMSIYIYTHIHLCTYIYIHTHTYIYTYTYTYIYIYAYIYIYRSKTEYSHIHTSCAYIYTYIYTWTRIIYILFKSIYDWANTQLDQMHIVHLISSMGWLQLVGCLKVQVSLQNTGLFCRALLQKRPIFLSILLIVATPYNIQSDVQYTTDIQYSTDMQYTTDIQYTDMQLDRYTMFG